MPISNDFIRKQLSELISGVSPGVELKVLEIIKNIVFTYHLKQTIEAVLLLTDAKMIESFCSRHILKSL